MVDISALIPLKFVTKFFCFGSQSSFSCMIAFVNSFLLLLVHSEQESGQAGNLIYKLAESPPCRSSFSHLQCKKHEAKHDQQRERLCESLG